MRTFAVGANGRTVNGMTDKERKSCICTIKMLRNLALNVHEVMDVIDYENCEKMISLLERFEPSAQPETAKRIVGKSRDGMTLWYQCDMCNEPVDAQDAFCRGCGRRLTDG